MLSFTQCTIYSDSQSLFVNAFHIIQLVYIFTMIMMAEFAFKRTDQCVMHTQDIIRVCITQLDIAVAAQCLTNSFRMKK